MEEPLNDPIPDAMAAAEQLVTWYKMLWTPLLVDLQETMRKAGIRDNLADSVISTIFRAHIESILNTKDKG